MVKPGGQIGDCVQRRAETNVPFLISLAELMRRPGEVPGYQEVAKGPRIFHAGRA